MSIEDQNIIVNKNQSSFVWNHEILHFQSVDAYNPGPRYMYIHTFNNSIYLIKIIYNTILYCFFYNF